MMWRPSATRHDSGTATAFGAWVEPDVSFTIKGSEDEARDRRDAAGDVLRNARPAGRRWARAVLPIGASIRAMTPSAQSRSATALISAVFASPSINTSEARRERHARNSEMNPVRLPTLETRHGRSGR